jgi:DNA-binding MarR family transcriptional regulator
VPKQGPEGHRGTAEPETRALRELQAAMGEATAALGRRMRMIATDLNAMNHLSASLEPMGPTDLAARLGLSPGATTELVDRLEQAGHLMRHRDPADRRRVRLVPTDSARGEVLGQIGSLIAVLDALAAGFTPEEREVVRRFLDEATRAYREWAIDEP